MVEKIVKPIEGKDFFASEEVERAPYRTTYYMLGVVLTLTSNAESVLQGFDRIYNRFRVKRTEFKQGILPGLNLSLISEKGGEGLLLLGPGIRQRLRSTHIPSTLFFYLLNFVYMVSDRLIFHAGAVSRNGRGLILCASSATGKTTLILELLRRSFEFLSDELAPIQSGPCLIEPFPRAIGLREGAIELHPWIQRNPNSEEYNVKGEFKGFWDPEDLPRVKISKEVPPSAVLFLAPPLEEKNGGDYQYLEIGFASVPEGLSERLEELDGVKKVEFLSDRYYPTFRLMVKQGIFLIESIERLSVAMDAPIFTSRWGRSLRTCFDASPCLRELSGSEGLLEWKKHLLNGRAPSRLMEIHGESPGRLLFTLAGLARDLRFYSLSVGNLKAMGDVVEGIAF